MKLFIVAMSFAALPAFGSHFITCDAEVEITHVTNLARLDGEAIFARGPVPKPDHEQVVALKVLKVTKEGRDRCFQAGSQHTLAVKAEQIGMYKKGDLLKVHYQNVGDRPGSRISWDIIK